MPLLSARRQAEPDSANWFLRDDAVRLVESVQREAIPDIMRVFGHDGLYLRPSSAVSATLSGNLLANVLSLHRNDGDWSGELRCADAALPLLPASQSLVFAAFVLESSSEPTALLAELARVLKPDGVLLLLTLSPWSPLRLSWGGTALRVRGASAWAEQLQGVGLEVERQRPVGPYWLPGEGAATLTEEHGGWLDGVRAARLSIARRREGGVTPLRWSAPAIGISQNAGLGST